MTRQYFVLLFLLAPVCLSAASFDCSKARTSVEKAICSSPDLRAADDKLDQAYRVALTRVPEATALVREAQRKWLQNAELSCSHQENDQLLTACLADEWETRAYFLDHITARMNGVPFFFREVSLGPPCDEEDMATGLPKASAHSSRSAGTDSEGDSCGIHATWPEAISNAPQWQAWNKAILDEARRFNASQDIDEKVPDHWVRFLDPNGYNDLDVSVDFDFVSPSLVAASISRTYTYAHPALQERAFVWLLRQGHELKADDLFRPDSGWEAWMQKHVAQIVSEYEQSELKETPSDAQEIAANAARFAVESRYWRITGNGLTFIFSEDDLGYLTAVNMPDVTFSWTNLRPYLNPNFEIPQQAGSGHK